MKRSQLKKLKEVLDENKQSLDDIQNHFYEIITLNVLTNEEVAALLMSLFMQLLDKPHNKLMLDDLGIKEVNLEMATKLIKIWTETYASKVVEQSTPTD